VSLAGEARARSLLDAGRFKEAAEMFISTGELASAARAYVAAKDFFRAAVCFEKAQKPLDAARLYQQIRHWSKAAELYGAGGDAMRAEMALEQLKREQEDLGLSGGPATAWAHVPVTYHAPALAPEPVAPAPAPAAPTSAWPPGELWQKIRSGDLGAAVKLYHGGAGRSGWELITEAKTPEVLKALAEMLFEARDHAVAAEAFQKAGDALRSAQCLSLAGLNEEAAHYYFNLGQKALAAQHLEKAQAWEQAAALYVQEELYLDAARCHEKDDDPVRAAGMYLKARKLDLALPLLQSVAPAHRSFTTCRLLAGKIFFQKGQKDLAITMLSPLLEAGAQTEEGLETVYQAAVLMEQGGALERAREAYQYLQETRFGYKDVAERLEALASAGAPAPAAIPSPAPAGTGAAHPAPAAPRVAAAQPAAQPAGGTAAPMASPASPASAAPMAPAASAAPMASKASTASAASAAPPLADEPAMDLAPLRDCSLFNRLGNEDLRRIWMIGKTGECKPGKVIIKAGEMAAGLMVVLAGGLTITPDPSNLSLATGFLGTGDYVGLGCLLKGPPQTSALVAQGGTRLLVLPIGALEALLAAEPDLGARFYRSVAEHLVQTLMAGGVRPTRPPG
jgi:tetratricopeptide (TPR) repeat protein